MNNVRKFLTLQTDKSVTMFAVRNANEPIGDGP